MAVRSFSDSKRREWQVWDVLPEAIHPPTKAEDYLADMVHTGWLVFELKSGGEKRRLAPVPAGWAERSDAELEALMQQAAIVPQRKFAGDVSPDASSDDELAMRRRRDDPRL